MILNHQIENCFDINGAYLIVHAYTCISFNLLIKFILRSNNCINHSFNLYIISIMNEYELRGVISNHFL